ncbi:MAG: helix-turn-helix transcriptional regulator [Pseudomonadota bacterium]
MHAALSQFDTYGQLLRAGGQPLRAAAGPEGAWVVQWKNGDTETIYRQPNHHTLSLYLRGGQDIRCRAEPDARGAPGLMCSLPAGHTTEWDVHGSVHLMHLYLPRLPLAQAAEAWFDLDPRVATLRDRIYFEDGVLHALWQRIVALDWDAPGSDLLLQELVLRMQARLLLAHSGPRRQAPVLRGGLAPGARRRVLEQVESALGAAGSGPLTLQAMADAAHLSVYHFSRMFKASFGVAPHAWVMQRRLGRARALLAQGQLPLREVAARCGFTSLSHMNTALRGAGLGSASRLRSALRGPGCPP